MSAILSGATICLAGLINIEEEIARLEKEPAKFTQEVQRVQGKLANERFVANAPEEVVAQERSKEADYLENKKQSKNGSSNCARFNRKRRLSANKHLL